MLRSADMQSAAAARPATTAVEAITLADLESTETGVLVQAWKKWRGWNAMPPYHAWTDAKLGRFTDHASVARVVESGRDYEFEFIGDAHLHAYGVNHSGSRVSDIERLSPRFGKQLRASYDFVRISRRPQAFQGTIGAEFPGSGFVWFETVYLPLSQDGVVGYILNAAMYRMRADG